jgi:HSP20 family protein
MSTNRLATLQSNLDTSLSREMASLRRRMHRFFGDDIAELGTEPVGWSPAVDLKETEKEFMLTADLPGMKPADVTVECQDGTLTIKGEKSEEKKEAGNQNRWHVYERSYGSFYRSFAFPQPVDAARSSAQFTNGVLTVTVPKAAAAKPTAHKIEIKSA